MVSSSLLNALKSLVVLVLLSRSFYSLQGQATIGDIHDSPDSPSVLEGDSQWQQMQPPPWPPIPIVPPEEKDDEEEKDKDPQEDQPVDIQRQKAEKKKKKYEAMRKVNAERRAEIQAKQQLVSEGAALPMSVVANITQPNPYNKSYDLYTISIKNQNSDYQPQSKVLMFTYVFGAGSVAQRYFHMFVESTRHTGFDFLIVGDTPPPFPLPPNVRHLYITWVDLTQRVYTHALNKPNIPLPRNALLNAGFYKVCEFKSLFAHLFPEAVEGYEWWGHCDTDLVLGNLTKFFSPDLLEKNDIISGGSKPSWGPFTLYRNIPSVNTLYQQIRKHAPMERIFADGGYHYFDEWNNLVRKGSNTSMTGMIRLYASELGLRHTTEQTGALMNDKGACKFGYKDGAQNLSNVPLRCGECSYDKGTLVYRRSVLPEPLPDQEVFLCNYQYAKKFALNPSLREDQKYYDLVLEQQWRSTYQGGFHYYDVDDKRRKGNLEVTA